MDVDSDYESDYVDSENWSPSPAVAKVCFEGENDHTPMIRISTPCCSHRNAILWAVWIGGRLHMYLLACCARRLMFQNACRAQQHVQRSAPFPSHTPTPNDSPTGQEDGRRQGGQAPRGHQPARRGRPPGPPRRQGDRGHLPEEDPAGAHPPAPRHLHRQHREAAAAALGARRGAHDVQDDHVRAGAVQDL